MEDWGSGVPSPKVVNVVNLPRHLHVFVSLPSYTVSKFKYDSVVRL